MKRIDTDRIKAAVTGDFFYYERTASTNTEALNGNAADKSLFVTKYQTAGRGRQNRRWEASEGGIYMTILLKPKTIPKDISALTLAVGLSVSRVIPDSCIKWPNDIVLGDKKVAGILLETQFVNGKGIIAAGIGINANNTDFCEELKDKATSVFLYSGKVQDMTEIIIKVYDEFIKVYDAFTRGFSEIREEYAKRCITLNREIVVIRDEKRQIMYAKDINDKGELLAEHDGKTEIINSGEVSVRGLLGYI